MRICPLGHWEIFMAAYPSFLTVPRTIGGPRSAGSAASARARMPPNENRKICSARCSIVAGS